jgi:hypothetical protein
MSPSEIPSMSASATANSTHAFGAAAERGRALPVFVRVWK